MTATPSRKTRMPSSARAVKITVPSANWKLPTQRTEKLSTGRPAGPPAPQSLLMVASHAVRVAGGVSVMLLKYSGSDGRGGGQARGGFTWNVNVLEVWTSGFFTETG